MTKSKHPLKMKTNKYLKLLFSLILAIISSCFLNAQKLDQKILEPPFMAKSENFSIVLFNLDAHGVQEILPEGVQPKIKEDGQVTAGLELYTTSRVQGMPIFSIAFIYVEVEFMESKNGTPGHWAIWGETNNKEVLASMKSNYGFPYQYSSEISITAKKESYMSTIFGDEDERLHIQLKKEQATEPLITQGIVNMCGKIKNGNNVQSEVTWFTTGQKAEVISIEVEPGENKVLQLLKDSKSFWAMVSEEQVFCYSIPISITHN